VGWYRDQGQQVDRVLVSIGMPVYNGEEYIRDALDALLRQTFADFELIISDNASSDRTEAICREYAQRDARIIYFRQKENLGAAANFQFVLDHARAGLFMWAAYDDEWAKNYLTNATALLGDGNIDFVFPAFSVRSIKLNIGKKFDEEIFGFIESTDRKQRVLQFLALHHDSHKCNIVYSLFRTEFLRAALKLQDIGNDGALGAVILGMGCGKVLNGALFRKRYPMLWPGALSMLFAWVYKDRSKEFESAKEAALNRLTALFPEYIDEIRAIFDRYRPYTHEKCYRICSIENGFGRQGRNNGSK
jgi:glycosyltransferase involved in cell wall biosynthesis